MIGVDSVRAQAYNRATAQHWRTSLSRFLHDLLGKQQSARARLIRRPQPTIFSPFSSTQEPFHTGEDNPLACVVVTTGLTRGRTTQGQRGVLERGRGAVRRRESLTPMPRLSSRPEVVSNGRLRLELNPHGTAAQFSSCLTGGRPLSRGTHPLELNRKRRAEYE